MTLPKQLHRRWQLLAKEQSLSAPGLLRLVMTRVLDGAEADVGLSEQTEKAASTHLSITLKPAEVQAAKDAAKKEGYTIAGWVAALLRARLKQQPILTSEELQALSAATLQLAAVGRNLNSAVYRLHREGRWVPAELRLKELADQVREVMQRANAVVDRATERGRF